jgi:hypothetical protein
MEPEAVFEKTIILRPISMTVGNVETNINAVLEAVKEKSWQYQDISKYAGDEKQAKDDRALLRKQKEAAKTTIKSIEEAWNRPLEGFLIKAKEVLKQFDYAINAIDEWVKEGEAREKDKKRGEIQAYFDGKGFDLVSLNKFFNDKWLNKTFKLPDIKQEIDAAIAEVYANIKILENIADHGMIAKAVYLETLDMGEAMRRVETLKANAERLAREQAAREERERQERVARNAAEERREEREAERAERVQSLAAEALDLPEETASKASAAMEQPGTMEYTLRFRGTREQLLKLREYMTANGIVYEKGYVFERNADALDYQDARGLDAPVRYVIFDAA